jgi:mono/diheme cytochrome c family protein
LTLRKAPARLQYTLSAMRSTVLPVLATLVTLAAAAALAQPAIEPPPPGEYRVIDGRVDRGTYFGWRVFHSACHGCHGFGATGTDVAPNLLERVRTMSPRDFAIKVLTSYRLMPPGVGARTEDRAREREATLSDVMRRDRGSAASRIVMPAWDDDDTVKPHVLDLYAYLMARADGKLAPGQPKLLAEKPLKNP